nr:hypothetical protein [Tanacetum cinerariifolium]
MTHLIKDCDYYEKQMVQKPVWNNAMRMNHQNSLRITHPHSNRNVVPTTILTRSRLVSLNAARPVSTVVPQSTVKSPRPVKHVVNKAHSPIRRLINHRPATKNSNFHKQVTTVKVNKVNVVPGNKGNVDKASANWVKIHSKLLDKGVINSDCSRYMNGNISFLSNFEEINGGYVAFGGNPKGDTECVVLSSDYKLPDENHVLRRVSRENNMYNVDLKNVVSSGDLTCLFAKAILDESNLWHRRLGYINFKTINKLVNDNLVRGIKREFSIARTLQQNKVAERKNRTLIEAARTMLADSLLPILFWAEAVNPACYVQNMILVTKPHNKTPYELLLGRPPSIGFMRPFGCPVTILNTLVPLGKFDGKAGEEFLVGYSVNSKAFRVFNGRTRIVQETLHINFLKNKPNVAGIGPKWLFDIDTLTKSMNYQPVVAENPSNDNTGIKENFDAGKVKKETVSAQKYMLLPLWSTGSQNPQNTDDDVADVAFDVKENENDAHVSANGSNKFANKKHNEKAKRDDKGKSHADSPTRVWDLRVEFKEFYFNNTNRVNVVSAPVNAAAPNSTNNTNSFNTASPSINAINMPELEDIVYSDDDEDVGAEADLSNLETNIPINPISTTRVHKDHHVNKIIGDLNSAPQTRSMTRMVKEQGGLHQINDEDFHICMFACFLSQEEPKKVHQVLKDPSWIEAMQEELLQFKLQKVWVLVDLPKGKRAIGSKWVFRNKKDERRFVIMIKARVVAQGHTQEEGIDYDEVFNPVARIEAIRLFLAYASFMGFMVYRMDVKSAFVYETIEEEAYVCQPPGFKDPDYPDKVYKVVKALYGLHQAPRAWYEILANYLLENGFQRGKIDQTLFIKKQKGDILLVQVYVDDIIFGSTNKELCKAFEKLMKDKF